MIKPVLHSFAYSLDFLREQVADVPETEMIAQPNGIMNHPAWVIGHLIFICQALGGAIGLPPWLPPEWASRYGPGSVPAPDPGLYETKSTALAMLDDAQSRLAEAVDQLEDARLEDPFPDQSYRFLFPTLGHAFTQVMVGHTAFHVGQVGVWRKGMGLPSLGRSFE